MNHLTLIAGPCSAESEQQVVQTAQALKNLGCSIFRAGVWKPRTQPGHFEGFGEQALAWLRLAKQETNMKVATEVALPQHVEQALRYGIDVLWIGARTTANPFAVQQIADALEGVDIPVMVKNPISPDLALWLGALERLQKAGVKQVMAIHRGFSVSEHSPYRNEPLWHLPIELRRLQTDIPLICDPSHMGGKPMFIQSLAQQALDLDYDGLMIECHPNPVAALSDAEQQITPTELGQLLQALTVREKNDPMNGLEQLRREIDQCDQQLIEALAQRMHIAQEIASYKEKMNLAVFQTNRYKEVLRQRMDAAEKVGIEPQFTEKLFQLIHDESVRQQLNVINRKEKKTPRD